MELKEGMSVVTPGGEEVGKVNRFVLDPATNEVTHIVLQKGWLLPEDKVVPFEMVREGSEGKIILSEEVGDFEQLPPFEETRFIRATDERPGDGTPEGDPAYHYTPAYYWYPSHANIGYPGFGLGYYAWPPAGETRRNIPEDTIPLKEGTDVISSDGEHVGDVERLIIEPDSGRATHFVISQGLLFKDRKLVPAHWVRMVEEDQVHLVVSARLLERLPAYEEA
jgi:sporulation protein YlmC with PRC-barrel domain